MDYKYIEQLLERYWSCKTTLEEEEILRAFFSQKDVPTDLLRYKDLFTYEQQSVKQDSLNDAFDEKILAHNDKNTPVKAKIIPMRQRLMPLFKAAAVIAIILTLGNAVQMAFNEEPQTPVSGMAEIQKPKVGPAVAKVDSIKTDSLQKGTQSQGAIPIIK